MNTASRASGEEHNKKYDVIKALRNSFEERLMEIREKKDDEEENQSKERKKRKKNLYVKMLKVVHWYMMI